VNVRALRTRQPASPALTRYTEAARILTGRPDASIADGLAWLRDTVGRLGVPGLRRLGLRPEDTDGIVANAARASSMQGNPIRLTDDELRAVLAAAA
jgi:alcohol dehydrogenase class IV